MEALKSYQKKHIEYNKNYYATKSFTFLWPLSHSPHFLVLSRHRGLPSRFSICWYATAATAAPEDDADADAVMEDTDGVLLGRFSFAGVDHFAASMHVEKQLIT